jgi:hypothetical protein
MFDTATTLPVTQQVQTTGYKISFLIRHLLPQHCLDVAKCEIPTLKLVHTGDLNAQLFHITG